MTYLAHLPFGVKYGKLQRMNAIRIRKGWSNKQIKMEAMKHRYITVATSLLAGITALGGVQAAQLGPVERAKYQHEAARRAAVITLAEKSRAEKMAAEAYARQHGLPVRFKADGAICEVMRLDEHGAPVYYVTCNHNAAISTAANLVRETAPYHVTGSNVTVGVWDGGAVVTTHQEFGARATVKDGGSVIEHATHVAGTIGAAGVSNVARGMAPGVLVDSYEWTSDASEMASRAASAPNQPGKMYLSNHSYGEVSGWFGKYWVHPITVTQSPNFGRYDRITREWDQIAYDAPYYLIVKAAGNDRANAAPAKQEKFFYWGGEKWKKAKYNPTKHAPGDGAYKQGYDTIPTYGVAKNILTVGAVNDAVAGGVRVLSNNLMSNFSSWGPTDDGRIKPDIVGNGVQLFSCTAPNSNSYTTFSGTSMASPNVCGSAALLVEYFGAVHPGSAMRASTLKALIIHTADDVGNPGPDYQYGWGLMNTLRAAQLIDEDAAGVTAEMIEHYLHSLNQVDTYAVGYDGSAPLRATLCWTDPPGHATLVHDLRTPRLVNDLDLRVYGPLGGTNFPFTLSYANPAAPATTGDNTVDNVEQVLLPAGSPAGTYIVTVGHKPPLSTPAQYYSLIVSGVIIPEPCAGLVAAAFLAWWRRTRRMRAR